MYLLQYSLLDFSAHFPPFFIFIFISISQDLRKHLQHTLDKFVDFFLAITGVTTFVEVNEFGFETTERRRKFEWMEEIVGFFETTTACKDFMNQIFHA